MTATVVAKLFAERDVKIEVDQRPFMAKDSQVLKPFLVAGWPLPMGNSWVAGIAGSGPVIFINK